MEKTGASVLSVPGRLDSVAIVRRWLEGLLAEWRVSERMSSDLVLALTEVCTNIVRHGYGDTPRGDIEITAARDDDATIRLTIEDDAPVYVPEKKARPPAPESLAEGGYGLSLVQRLADEVRHEPLGTRGNRTTLIKYRAR